MDWDDLKLEIDRCEARLSIMPDDVEAQQALLCLREAERLRVIRRRLARTSY